MLKVEEKKIWSRPQNFDLQINKLSPELLLRGDSNYSRDDGIGYKIKLTSKSL